MRIEGDQEGGDYFKFELEVFFLNTYFLFLSVWAKN
jgi:hypothetical protein